MRQLRLRGRCRLTGSAGVGVVRVRAIAALPLPSPTSTPCGLRVGAPATVPFGWLVGTVDGAAEAFELLEADVAELGTLPLVVVDRLPEEDTDDGLRGG